MINEIGDERRRGGRGNNNDAAYILKAAEIAGMPRAKLSLVMPVKLWMEALARLACPSNQSAYIYTNYRIK